MKGAGVVALAVLLCSVPLAAQPQPAPGNQPAPAPLASDSAEPSGETVAVTFFNRPIVSLRARVLGRSPQERAAAAQQILQDLVAQGITGPVESQPLEGGTIIRVGSRGVLVLMPPDVDTLLGETLEADTAQAVTRLQQALAAAAEGRAPRLLLQATALALLGLVAGLAALWGMARLHRAVSGRWVLVAEQTITQTGLGDAEMVRASRLVDVERQLLRAIIGAVDLVIIYIVTTFVLRRFPYTRPWGESMRGFLLASVEQVGLGILGSLPDLFTVLLIVVIARFVARMIGAWFNAVERGRVTARWIYPETAQPTRRLLTTLVWLFALVMAYPYLPGSQTQAFRGVSVFLGLILTIGSSGLVNQIMSGFMITYSRALRLGDFVRIGDVEGTVTHLGVLSTKVRTLQREEVTIPNAVVVGQTTTDYTRAADSSEGVYTPVSVTIGYDAPWRQVQSLLALAAERTPGLRRTPKPVVLQTALEDFYVKYTLFVCLEHQESRLDTLHALHSHIQDLFNEYGVQIMSPNYFVDPATPKVVAKKDWFAAPAKPG